MEKYHKYVFEKDKFVGEFESMYRNESTDYDSWYQSDLRDYGYQLSLAILNQYNFETILDVGCGKGLFTSFLKKKNNRVAGWDISETAIKTAKVRYKDIFFEVKNIDIDSWQGTYHLVVFHEVLSYTKNWKKIIEKASQSSVYIFVSLDLPEEPIGFIKSFEELEREVKKYYEIIVSVKIKTKGNQMLILAKVRK